MFSERYEDTFIFLTSKKKKKLRNIIWNHNPILRINLFVIYTILLLRNEKVNCEECEIRKKKSVRWIFFFLYVFVYIFHNFVWRLSKSFHLFYLYKKIKAFNSKTVFSPQQKNIVIESKIEILNRITQFCTCSGDFWKSMYI